MSSPLDILRPGSCETFKAGVHVTALGLVAVMGTYNAAAWFRRRERHLAVNAVLYAALTLWECAHVSHHLEEGRRRRDIEAANTPAVPAIRKPTRVAA